MKLYSDDSKVFKEILGEICLYSNQGTVLKLGFTSNQMLKLYCPIPTVVLNLYIKLKILIDTLNVLQATCMCVIYDFQDKIDKTKTKPRGLVPTQLMNNVFTLLIIIRIQIALPYSNREVVF